MKEIKYLVKRIDEEIHDSLEYAEKALDMKAHGNLHYKVFHRIAEDELHHATELHSIAVEEINLLKQYYTPTADMEEKWAESHTNYVAKTEWIKSILNM